MKKYDVYIRLIYRNGYVRKTVISKHGTTPKEAEEIAVSCIEGEFNDIKDFEVMKVVQSPGQ